MTSVWMTALRCFVAITGLLCLVRCGESAEAEKHFIPEGYVGYVVIAHVADGEPARYEGNTRIYEIPETGLLLSSTKPNPGLGRLEYYYHQPGGQPKRIPLSLTDKQPGDEVTRVYGMVTGGYGNPGEQCDIPYERYFVGSYADYIKVRDDTTPDPRVVELWNRCREATGT